MRKIIFCMVILFALAACGRGGNGDNGAEANGGDSAAVPPSPGPDGANDPTDANGSDAPTLPGIGGPPGGALVPPGGVPGLPGLPGAGAVPAPPSDLPVPAQGLSLPVARRVLSAGDSRSAVIAADGSLWMWGGHHVPEMSTFAFTVLQGALDGWLTIYDPRGGELSPSQTVFMEDTARGRIYYLQCRTSMMSFDINELDIRDADGGAFTFENLLETVTAQEYEQLNPHRTAENVAAVYAHKDRAGWVVHIGEDGNLYSFWGELLAENAAAFVRVRHAFGDWQSPTLLEYGILRSDGSLLFMDEAGRAHEVAGGAVVAAEAGMGHMLFLSYNNELWARGGGPAVGVLGQSSEAPPARVMENVAQIAAGIAHSMALTQDGRLYTWGENQLGQLGTGRRSVDFLPAFIMDDVIHIAAGHEYSLAITSDGNLWGWGCNRFGQLGVPGVLHQVPQLIMENVVAVSAGVRHTLAITADGTLWAWGNNEHGQLGDGTRLTRSTPVQIMTGVMVE